MNCSSESLIFFMRKQALMTKSGAILNGICLTTPPGSILDRGKVKLVVSAVPGDSRDITQWCFVVGHLRGMNS